MTLATSLLPGASINVQFRFGIQQMGKFRAYLHIEALTEPDVAAINDDGQSTGGRRKKSKSVSQTSVAPSGQSTPEATDSPVLTPLTRRLGDSGIWVVSPRLLRDAPARANVDDSAGDSAEGKPKAHDEAQEKSEKESETAPATSEQPTPPTPAPAAASEPVATTTAPAAAPLTNTTSAAPAATRVNIRKKNVSASKAGQRPASRRAVARRRGALKRR